MIDFGFVIAAFTPLVLYWMYDFCRITVVLLLIAHPSQIWSEPSSCRVALILGPGSRSCTGRVHLAPQYGWTCPIQEGLYEERPNPVQTRVPALLEIIGCNLFYMVEPTFSKIITLYLIIFLPTGSSTTWLCMWFFFSLARQRYWFIGQLPGLFKLCIP